MSKSADAALLALIATLEQRAKAKGEKSVVKGVVARLADAGASPELIAEIAGLRKKVRTPEAAKALAPKAEAAEVQAPDQISAPAQAKASVRDKAKAKPGKARAKAVEPETAAQG